MKYRLTPKISRRSLLAAGALLPLAYKATAIGLVTQSGPQYYAVQGGGGGGSDLAYETSATKYVSNAGADSGSAGPFATIAYGLTQISNGQSLGVLTNLTEVLSLSSMSGGASGNYKSVVAIDAVRTITGAITAGSGSSKYLRFKGLHFEGGTDEIRCELAPHVKFIACGFFGGPLSGNTVTHVAGSNQLYEGCWFGGMGGRYASLCYLQDDTVYRHCVVRTDTWGSPPDDGNPNGGIQIYSSDNCHRQNCVAVDCLPQRTNHDFIGGFPVTTNVEDGLGVTDTGCIAADLVCPGFQIEGSENVTYTGTDNIAVRCTAGLVKNMDDSGTLTINGGEYSDNEYGIAGFNAGTVTVSNVNTTSNNLANFVGVTDGGGNTTNALDMNALLSSMKRIGVSETLYGETGWNVEQSEDLFPFPYESEIRAKYATLSTRGFCGGSYTLTSYLKR